LRVDAEEGAEIVDEKTTIPATLSKIVQTEILRNQMGFKGLIVSDAMSMSGLTLYMDQAEAGVRAVLAGTDILEKPADTVEMLRGLREAVKSGRISKERLDESVRRQLAWKHELGLFKEKIAPIDAIDKVVSTREVYQLAEEIAAGAITLVRNNAGLLPLDRSKKIAFIGLSNGFDGEATAAAFNRTARDVGARMTSVVIQENSTPETIRRAREAVAGADIVIAGMFGRVRSGAKNSVGLPDEGVKILRELLSGGKPVIGIGFGNPYILGSFPDLSTYLVAYGDMPSLQRAAARSVFGTQSITGRLPISLPGLHPIGTGIRIESSVQKK
jgi:beta-N-acetylhexosaminidase